MNRTLVAGLVAILAAIIPAKPASAHGGSEADLTSDYRTRITHVPAIDGLDARAVGLDGIIELTWTGPGTLIVDGYEGEPYLRFDDTGVAINMRSPAAYLNQDRYADVDLPATADPTAAPDWQTVRANNSYQWHDHRTHWMSSAPPPQAQQDPSRSHVIYDRWEIPITIDGDDAVIAGDLTWAPAPPLLPWLGLALLVAIGASLALWSPIWRPAAAGLALIGAAALTADTIGFVAATDDTRANTAWAFVYAVAAISASVWLAIHALHRTPDPTLAMMIAGLVLVFMGGLDRFDVLTSGFYQSALDTTAARATTVVSLGIGLALTFRFMAFLVPLLVHRRPTDARHREPQHRVERRERRAW